MLLIRRGGALQTGKRWSRYGDDMKSATKRRLEALAGAVPVMLEAVETDEAFLSRLEIKLDLLPGSLPRNVNEAVDRGYSSVIEALAGAVGVTYAELKQFLLTSR